MRRWLVLLLAGIMLMLVITREHGERVEGERTVAAPSTAAHAAAARPELPAIDPQTGETIAIEPPDAPALQRLEGLVVGADEQPVAGARVTLGKRVVVTEADGAFAFDDLAIGSYTVIAERDGWYAEEQDVRLDDTSEPVTLQLALGVTLVARVIDEAGAPIVNANIHVTGRDYKTGADGVARARGVDLEGEMVVIAAPGHARLRTHVETGDDPTATIERTFTLHSGAEISGTVVDQDGAPVEQAYVSVESSLGNRSESAWTDDKGVWRIPDLGKASYTIIASSKAAISVNDRVVAHDGLHALTGIELRVLPGGEIEGVVVDARGTPVSGARISGGGVSEETDDAGHFLAQGLAPDTYTLSVSTPTHGALDQVVKLAKGQHARVRFVVIPSSIAGIVVDARGQPVADATVAGRSEAPDAFGFARTDERGRFDMGGLPPGRYSVSASRDGSRVDGPSIEIATGTRDARLVVNDPARVTGRVVMDGVPVPYFGFALTEDAEDSYRRPTTVRDPNGRFTEKDATPGTYALILVGPSFGKKAIANVRVIAGQTTDLGDIAVTRGDVLRGRVVDAQGAAVAGATVALAPDTYSPSAIAGIMRGARRVTTDASGAFEIPGVPPSDDERVIEATHPTRGASPPLVLAPGAAPIELVLVPTGRLEGEVMPPKRDLSTVVARRIDQPGRYTADITDGAFVFGQLPPGEYELSLLGESVDGQPRVTIRSGATVRTTLAIAQDSGSGRMR